MFCKETGILADAHNERTRDTLSLIEDTTMFDEQVAPSGDLKLINILKKTKDYLATGEFDKYLCYTNIPPLIFLYISRF